MARMVSHSVAVPKPWVPHRGFAINLLVSLRPHQWSKNLLVFAGLLFSRRVFDVGAFLATFAAFAIFCALSGVVYLTNDVLDRASDAGGPAMLEFHQYFAFAAAQIAATPARVLASVRLGFGRAFSRLAPAIDLERKDAPLWRMDAKLAEYCLVGQAKREGLYR